MDVDKIASRLASLNVEAARRKTRSKKPKRERAIVKAPTEWACRAEMSVAVSFEGDTARAALVKKLKSEIAAMVESAVKITARDLHLDPSDIDIRMTALDVDVVGGDTDSGDD